MEFGFGGWMGDDDLPENVEDSDAFEDSEEAEMEEEEVAEEELLDTAGLQQALDEAKALDLETVAAVGGAFGAAIEDIEGEEREVTEESNPFDAKDMEILSNKGMAPVYRDDPEFARFVWDKINDHMKEADRELLEKRRKIEKK